jgi:phage tail-like protein
MNNSDKLVTGFHFSVNFLNLSIGVLGAAVGALSGDVTVDMSFSEVSGIGSSLQTEEVAEGGNNTFKYKLPKPSSHQNLVLKRALSTAPSLLIKWANEGIQNFNFSPCVVVVSLLNNNHIPIKVWSFHNAYPIKLEVSGINAKNAELVIETLELAYNYSNRIL